MTQHEKELWENGETEITVKIGDTVTSWKKKGIDWNYDDILQGFNGCMIGHTFAENSLKYVCQRYLEDFGYSVVSPEEMKENDVN